MDALAGMTGTYFDGVFFTEFPGIEHRLSKKQIVVKIRRQNANLQEVKRGLAKKVTSAGGNALVGFTYGQKGTMFGWDKGEWQGKGFAATF
jgi:hypothetical protein